ncbi:hypothetical protein PPYR_11643 [Photinus pyralis]|uniref:Lipase domain-containing protein n=2 Tax=Photinus pyralis TaxID=7054 RepID=A0A5N4ABV6_PHOPY|nr:hypothetical protein PPYR_11643 [Photinus pyralis]
MNSTKGLVVLLPGLGEDYLYASTAQIKNAYFDYNVSVPEIIEVDYNVGVQESSLLSAPEGFCNYFHVSEKLAEFINNLNTSHGFQIEDMHLIGVSFGAHLAGVTGYILQTKYGYTLKRITGLDPLGAGYNCVTCPSLRLNQGDAKFVDVIHTNPGRIGVLEPLGDIDFYVN